MKTIGFFFSALAAATLFWVSCGSVAEDISNDGLLLNDDLVAVRSQDGTVSIKNAATGKCGVIDKAGKWLIAPEYDNVSAYKEYAIVTKSGVTKQMSYDGTILNSFVLDTVKEVTYSEKERYENREGELEYVTNTIKTGLFAYCVGGRYGLMDANCKRLTDPLYRSIEAVNKNMFRATLLDHYSEVILNAKGEVMR